MPRLYPTPHGFPKRMVGFDCPVDLFHELRTFAFDHTTIADVIRAALREYLDKWAATGDWPPMI
jgi:hypothetical protein